MRHAPDPDEIVPTSAEVIAYAERIEALGRAAPEPGKCLAYGEDRGQWLDVYAPSGAEGLPILLFFHGGSWISGHLGWLRFMASAVNALPAVLVAGTYRLAPRCRWPAQLDDVRAALDLVSRMAGDIGGDAGRIAIGGHSAGGHLASLAALQPDRPPLRACLPVSASFDLQYGDVPLESEQGRVYRYLFAHNCQDKEASPLNFASQARLPFHISWGARDFERVTRSSHAMVAALETAGAKVSHAVVPGASHFDTHLALSSAADPWYGRLRTAFDGGIEKGGSNGRAHAA